MWMHITLVLVHLVVFGLTIFFTFRAFREPTRLDYQYQQSYARIALVVSETVV